MHDPQFRTAVPGSDRRHLPGSELTAPVPPDQRIEITVVVRRRQPLPDPPPALSKEELANRYGADAADIATVTAAVQAAGAEVVATDPGSRRLRVAGSVGDLARLFGTSLTAVRAHDPATGRVGEFRARTGRLTVPSDLAGVVVAVLGLDNRPQARSRLVIAPARAVSISYSPVELATVYRFPPDTDGAGRKVAIIELGGGYRDEDLRTYFNELGVPLPSVRSVGVDGASNAPEGNPDGADGEVLLDIEVVGALAPAADIVVYFAPNSDAGFVDAVSTAAHADPTPAAISISWGQSEDEWTAQARSAMDEAFADAVALGVTVTAAAGDDGSGDRASDRRDHCDYPAASPYVLGCGGTALLADPATGAVSSEKVWNDGSGRGATGGGVSDAYPLPDWQAHVGVPESTGGKAGRGVPDVAAVADPQTGYRIRVDGQDLVIGGTSAVAPLWAALAARLGQSLKRGLGLLQPALYAHAAPGRSPAGFRDITDGDNGGYAAGPGWDACTGLGVPDGEALLNALRGQP